MTKQKRIEAFNWLPTLLQCLGLEKTSGLNTLNSDNYFVVEPEKFEGSAFEIGLVSELHAIDVQKRLKDFDVETTTTKFKRNATSIKMIIPILDILKHKIKYEEKPFNHPVYSEEETFLRKLFSDAKIAVTVKKFADEDYYFTITTTSQEDCSKVEEILDASRFEFTSEDNQLLVLAALPDFVLREKRPNESSEERKERNILEYAHRLLFFLKNVFSLKEKVIAGKKPLSFGFFSISGKKGERRVNFSSIKEKDLYFEKLTLAGFICERLPNGECLSIIVDLTTSSQKVLAQDTEIVLPAPELKQEPVIETTPPELDETKPNSITAKTEKMDQKPKVALKDIKKLLRANGIKPGTHPRKDGEITLNVSAGGATLGIQKIIEKFGISAGPSPRGTSIVLKESEVSIEERNPRQKKDTDSKKQNLLSIPDAFTQLHLSIQNEVKNTRTELERDFYLISKNNQSIGIHLGKTTISDMIVTIPMKEILKALEGK